MSRALKSIIDENFKLLQIRTGVRGPDWRWGGSELDFFTYKALALYSPEWKEVVVNRALLISMLEFAVQEGKVDDFFKLLRHLLAEEYWHYVQHKRGDLMDKKELTMEEVIEKEREAKVEASKYSGLSEEKFNRILYWLTQGEFVLISPEEEKYFA